MDFFSLLLPFTLFTSIVFVFISKNPVYGVLSFVVVVMHAVFLLILLDLEFLAYILAIVYIGAIVVLFLFVIMMFYIHHFKLKRSLLRGCAEYYLVAYCSTQLAYYFAYLGDEEYVNVAELTYSINLISLIARYLFNEHLFLTVLAALIMLVGIIGAIMLTVRSAKREVPVSFYLRSTITSAVSKLK